MTCDSAQLFLLEMFKLGVKKDDGDYRVITRKCQKVEENGVKSLEILFAVT